MSRTVVKLIVQIIVSSFLLLSCYGLWSLWQLPIRSIQFKDSDLSGPEAAQVMHILAPWHMQQFFQADLMAWQAELEQLPWVKMVQIRRQWPATMLVTLQKHRYLGHWHPDGALTSDGIYVQLTNSEIPPIFFEAPQGMHAVVFEQYQAFETLLSQKNLTLTGVTLEPRGAWTLTLENDLQIKLGRYDLLERLNRFVGVSEQVFALSSKKLETVDLRYMRGMALQYY